MDNKLLAKILFKNKIAPEEVIKAQWGRITPEKNIAQVLVDTGEISEELYPKIINAYKKRLAKAQAAAEDAKNAPAPAPKPASPVPPTRAAVDQAPIERNRPAENKPKPASAPLDIAPISNIPDVESASGLEGSSITQMDLAKVEVESVSALEQTSISSFSNDLDLDKLNKEKMEKSKAEALANLTSVAPTPLAQPQVANSPEDKKTAHLPPLSEGNRGINGQGPQIPEKLNGSETLDELLAYARFEEGTDLHLSSENPILLKKFGELIPCSEPLTTEQMEGIIRSGLTEEEYDEFMVKGDLEKVASVNQFGRFRLTAMKQQRGYDLTARVIPNEIPKLQESGLPESAFGLTKWAQGLVLVTGPAGAGKTRTLSMLVNEVIQSRKDHIITIESPIEVVYPPGPCQVTQRQVGTNTQSQTNALRAALRQDPDIIVVSELRDLESMELAISAAETGHLVFATMNTSNAMRTLSRLIDSFPPEEQDIIRSMVSESLRGVISQQLIPAKGGGRLVTAFEILLTTLPIANLIRKNEMHQLESAMITGRSNGMVVLDDSLKELVDAGEIEGAEAYHRAVNPKNFERYMS